MNPQELLEAVVGNAFDFLHAANADLLKRPKYSLINFHASVELFLKARLMAEHWTLMVSPRMEADRTAFVKGDFVSVGLNQSFERLQRVLDIHITASQRAAFLEVAAHRNRMVHFVHEAVTQKETDDLAIEVVKQQLRAWHFLHALLLQWRDIFGKWESEITRVDDELRKHYTYLQIVFDEISPKLKGMKKEGVLIERCPACYFDAQQHDPDIGHPYLAYCHVCHLSEKCLRVVCECESTVVFRDDGFGTCENCGKKYEPEDIASALISETDAYIAAKDEGDMDWGIANCGDCQGYGTVARLAVDDWVCASCFGEFERADPCEWCNERSTGDMEGSNLSGCDFCDGMAGQYRDD